MQGSESQRGREDMKKPLWTILHVFIRTQTVRGELITDMWWSLQHLSDVTRRPNESRFLITCSFFFFFLCKSSQIWRDDPIQHDICFSTGGSDADSLIAPGRALSEKEMQGSDCIFERWRVNYERATSGPSPCLYVFEKDCFADTSAGLKNIMLNSSSVCVWITLKLLFT